MSHSIAFVSLGCDKNLVDSEQMLGALKQGGYNLISDEQSAEVLIVNTCCFIEDAKQESINTILEVARYKQSGNCKALIVAGCMAQRYKEQIVDEIPEVDAVVGTTSYEKIVEIVDEVLLQKGIKYQHFDDIDKDIVEEIPRVLTTPGYFAYVKIAEGCNNHCTYCIIPQLRGKYRSRAMNRIEQEIKLLVKQGVTEVLLVAQDITQYGNDLTDASLVQLLQNISKIEDLEWIRLLYCYPEGITDELIEEIATNPKICHYLDIPIQHAADPVLKRMARKSTQGELKDTLHKLRTRIPDIAIRTTLIVGFPGETEEDFKELYQFVEEMRFDRLGVFTYSQEEGTAAAKLPDQLDESVKQERKKQIMQLQNAISRELTQEKVGKNMRVLIEGKLTEEDVYIGRTYQDAPEIDGQVFIEYDGELLSGDYVMVHVVAASDYDLIGEVVS